MYRTTLRLLAVLGILGAVPACAAQAGLPGSALSSTGAVTSVAAATGAARQLSTSTRAPSRPARQQWQGNPARKGYDDFRSKHYLRPEGQHRLPRPRIQRDGSWRPGRRD